MEIKRIFWRRNFFSQLRRNYGAINSTNTVWTKNIKKDHALEWGPRNLNPGMWSGITNRIGTKSNPTIINLENSHNNIEIWVSDNPARGNKPKINQQIWKDDTEIIDIWFYHNFKLTYELMEKYEEINGALTNDETIFYNFIKQNLILLPNLECVDQLTLRDWVSQCISQMAILSIDMSWFIDSNFNGITSNIANSILMIIQCEDRDNSSFKYYVSASKISELPINIANEIMSNENEGCIVLDTLNIDKQILDIIETLKVHKNVILYGPPGTGKSYLMNKVKDILNTENKIYEFCENNIEKPIRLVLEINGVNSKWCTFHQSYSYNNFVVGIKPETVDIQDNKKSLIYKSVNGPFLDLALLASPYIWSKDLNGNLIKKINDKYKPSILLIDEINRANTAEVFGDLITVLEPNKRLDYSGNIIGDTIGIELNNEYKYMDNISMTNFYMPSEMYLLASMNSLDKSVAPLDVAFKRRFKVIKILPSPEVLMNHYKLNKAHLERNIYIDKITYYKVFAYKLFINLNKYIEKTKGEDYLLGQAYFWEMGEDYSDLKEKLLDIIRYKIFPQLKELYETSQEEIIELFGINNKGILYHIFEDEYNECIRLNEVENINDEILLKAYSYIANIEYTINENSKVAEACEFNSYQQGIIEKIILKLKENKNCILYGPPGTGKSYIANEVKKYFLNNNGSIKWVTFHPNMSYENFIIGMRPTLSNNFINYEVKNGSVLNLIEENNNDKLLIIDEINRGNTGEIFGELITLFEKDKRENYVLELPYEYFKNDIKTKEFSLPNNFYTLGTMNAIDKSIAPLDSALKRRFYIINIAPDYHLLDLYFETTNISINIMDIIDSKEKQLKLAILVLKLLNNKISKYKGEEYMLGHAYIWGLKEAENVLKELYDIFDNNIINFILDLFEGDNEALIDIFSETSPILNIINDKVIIREFRELSDSDKLLAIRRIAYEQY